MSDPKLFLIDAHALCYRAYFAIRGLATSYGQATNAVYGFINILRKILKDHRPEYIAVCFDSAKKTRREEKFAEYKVHRPSMPDDLVSQIPLIKEVVSAYNLPVFEIEGFEADDLIATLAAKAGPRGPEVVIVSDDKDMVQLLNGRTRIFSARNDAFWGHAEIKDKFGVDPSQITDYIALAGDKTDNIPGVNGIGEVTARGLIGQFGTVENIFKNLDKLSSEKVRQKLADQKEQAFLSKELAILDGNVPLEFDLKKLKITEPNRGRLLELFRKLEFRRLAEELQPEEPQAHIDIQPVNNEAGMAALSERIKKAGRFAFFPDMSSAEGFEDCRRILVACSSDAVYEISRAQYRDLQALLDEKALAKITYDMKNVLKVLESQGCVPEGPMFDMMIADYLLTPSQGTYDIGTLAWKYLKKTVDEAAQPGPAVIALLEMYDVLKEELKEKSLLKLFEDLEIPLACVLFKMEQTGVKLDQPFLKEMSAVCEKRIQALLQDIYKLADGEFNLNSPKQLSQVLFEKLKLPVIKKTKTGFSTDEGVLMRLADKHKIIEKILEYRQLAKLKSTYIDALPKLIDPQSGRLHATFNQTGTETGRLSSSNPNLQNIPIRTDLGQQIRKAFVPYEGKQWILSADYSQIELRILAHLAKDKNLRQAFEKDEDIHTFTAALIFDVKEKDVTARMRNAAKRVNFGIIYGISPFGLAKDLNISQQEAQEFIDKYFLRYPGVKKFMDAQIKFAEEKGYVLTILNRRRYIPEIHSDNMAVQQFAQRQAINTPVQGSAADLIKLAMVHIQKELEKKRLRSRMIITVHDELVFNVVEEEKEEVVKFVREQMENSLELSVPVKVSMKIGKNWLETKEI